MLLKMSLFCFQLSVLLEVFVVLNAFIKKTGDVKNAPPSSPQISVLPLKKEINQLDHFCTNWDISSGYFS